MRRAGALSFPLAALLVLLLAPVAVAGASVEEDDPDAVTTLRRAAVASALVTFTGTQLVSTWTAQGSSSRIVDVSQRGRVRQVRARPAVGATAQAGQAGPVVAPDVALSQTALNVLLRSYQVIRAGTTVVAGRQVSVVEVRRGGRPVARLGIDSASGLLLREEVLDASGAPMRRSVFLEVSVTESAADLFGLPRALPHPSPSPAATTPVPVTAATTPAGTGWTQAALAAPDVASSWPCPHALPDGLELVDARWAGASDQGSTGRALHLTYTDGLSGLSVFVQKGTLDARGLEAAEPGGWTRQNWSGAEVSVGRGLPVRVVWEGGGHVFTLVSDTPMDQIRAAVGALPHDGGDHALSARVAGLARQLFAGPSTP